MFVIIHECEAITPALFIQIHEHPLLELIFPVVNGNGVVVSVEAMDQCLDGGLLEMSEHRGCLAGLLAQHHQVWVDKSECINHHFA